MSLISRTLDDMDPVLFLNPFLDVIRCEVVTGPVTGQALVSCSFTNSKFKLLIADYFNF